MWYINAHTHAYAQTPQERFGVVKYCADELQSPCGMQNTHMYNEMQFQAQLECYL